MADTQRYTVIAGVGIITTDEQVLANYGQLFVQAVDAIARELANDPMFEGKLEVFAIDREPHGEAEVPE